MAISYKKLWKMLIDKDMKKKDLCCFNAHHSASFRSVVSGTISIISPISHCRALHIFTSTSVVTFSFLPSFAIEA